MPVKGNKKLEQMVIGTNLAKVPITKEYKYLGMYLSGNGGLRNSLTKIKNKMKFLI